MTDISLTERPINPKALVLTRRRVTPGAEFFSLVQQRVDICKRLLQLMQEIDDGQRQTA